VRAFGAFPDLTAGFNGRFKGKERGREGEKGGWSNIGRNAGTDEEEKRKGEGVDIFPT